jgi:hypothetical protein
MRHRFVLLPCLAALLVSAVGPAFAETAPAPTTITIKTSASKTAKAFELSGVLTPGMMGDPCVVYVKKPGSPRFSYSSARLCYAETGTGGAKWWYRYTQRLKGTYYFKVAWAGNAERLPSISGVIKVICTGVPPYPKTVVAVPVPTVVAPVPSVALPAGGTVYRTNTGTKYHRGTCGSLSQSKIPLTVGEAQALGLGPCGTCKP